MTSTLPCRNKVQYLDSPHVINFVDWLSINLDNHTFSHSYRKRRQRCNWSCNSLDDACLKYDWPHSGVERLGLVAGRTFDSSDSVLTGLKSELKVAIENNNDELCLTAAKDILKWGGVFAHNGDWLDKNKYGISMLFSAVQSAINSSDLDQSIFAKEGFRFNAGLSKIYSLTCNEIIIYDSRVAAALGYGVLKYCQHQELPKVPDLLLFPWMPAKENNNITIPKQRNPSVGSYIMPRLSGAICHLEWNLKASWLLSHVMTDRNIENSGFARQKDPLRAIEAALFMIGYDLSRNISS